MKKKSKAHGSQASSGELGGSDDALSHLIQWLDWLRKDEKGGPSPSRAADILGCTRPMVNQLVKQGILERSVYEEDGFGIVVISQRSIDSAVENKKKTGCWSMPQAFTWRRLRASEKSKDAGGTQFRMVATPWKRKVEAAGGLKRSEINLSVDNKLALLNKLSPFGDLYTREMEVCCIHCGHVFRVYEAKVVESYRSDMPLGMAPPRFWIHCKHWPICSGSIVDWMPEDGEGKRLRGWEGYWNEHDRLVESDASRSGKMAEGK